MLKQQHEKKKLFINYLGRLFGVDFPLMNLNSGLSMNQSANDEKILTSSSGWTFPPVTTAVTFRPAISGTLLAKTAATAAAPDASTTKPEP